jgi:predicted N-acetyltransferase YhbS
MKETPAETVIIRPASLDELPLLTEIEIDAFPTLAEALGDTRDPLALSRDVLRQSLDEGLLFVAADAEDRPIAFMAGTKIEGSLYLTELDVARQWQRKGVGRRLMCHAIEVARANGFSGVTLTTDRYVPFNGPFYGTLGFALLGEVSRPAFLHRKLAEEIENGMDAHRRVAMALWF